MSTTAQLYLPTKMLINGDLWSGLAGKTFATVNPATEEIITEVPQAMREDVDLAVHAARQAFDTGPWRRMDARERGRYLYRLSDLMEKHKDELAYLETLDNGKPFVDSLNIDLPLAIDCLRYYAGYADKIHGSVIPIRGNYLCYTEREPVGVVGQIIPWNFPILMVAWKWGPALAAGCTVVLKPAEQTPLTALRLGELAMEADFPPGVINVISGGGYTGQCLVEHPGIDKIAFTGSTEVGRKVAALCGDRLKRCSLELGGKSPNIVFADADIDAAAQGAFFGLFFNQGQCCCAGSRVYVEDRVHDALVNRLVDAAQSRCLGDPFEQTTQQGPQVSQEQLDKVMTYIASGKEKGARCLTGGNRFGERGYFVEPTVFTEVEDDMRIAREEIFGPVMSVMRFTEIDEIVARSNDTTYGLAAAVWTRDIAKAHRAARAIRAGTVWINCYDVFDAAAPFGGFKESGIGRELGEVGLEPYTEVKTITVNLG